MRTIAQMVGDWLTAPDPRDPAVRPGYEPAKHPDGRAVSQNDWEKLNYHLRIASGRAECWVEAAAALAKKIGYEPSPVVDGWAVQRSSYQDWSLIEKTCLQYLDERSKKVPSKG